MSGPQADETSTSGWEGIVVKKYRGLLDGSNLYRRILVRTHDGQTLKVRVDRAMWAALTVGDTVRKTPDGLQTPQPSERRRQPLARKWPPSR